MQVVVTFVIVILLALWAVSSYNRLIGLRKQVAGGWRQIDMQLKRRHDLIHNLVSTLRATIEIEREPLEAVIAARDRATTATGPADAAVKESKLSQTLGRLFALVEAHPQLTANDNVMTLREELTGTEHKVGLARQFYNGIATKYNTATKVIPGSIVAGFGSFPPAELFEMNDAQ